MSTLTIPNIFVNATTIQAAPFNANFAAVATSVNGIDNTNIGAAGLFASQIVPTSAPSATFGGLIGYTFLAPSATTIPLTIAMAASQSVAGLLINGAASITGNLLEVDLTSGGTNAFKITSGGNATFASGYVLAGSSVPAGIGAGDLGAARNLNAGAVALGGAGNAAWIDFNISNGFGISITRGPGDGDYPGVFGGTYTNLSDASKKTNVAPISGALELLMKLKPSSYDWIDSGLSDMGFLAQEVEAILPQLVRTDNADIKGLVYTGITALLVAAFQDYVLTHP